MAELLPRTWWPKTLADAKTLALDLQAKERALHLFEYLAVAAAIGDWAVFTASLEALCDMSSRGIRTVLDGEGFDTGWVLLYAGTGMPNDLFPLFVEVVRLARERDRER